MSKVTSFRAEQPREAAATNKVPSPGALSSISSPPRPPARINPNSGDNCNYSTDTEFYYVSALSLGRKYLNTNIENILLQVDGKLREIDDFYREVRTRGELGPGPGVVMVDPVYEVIPECSDTEQLYTLPQDSRPVLTVNNNNNNHNNNSGKTNSGKLRSKSHEKIKSICRSISSPLKMNEFLHPSAPSGPSSGSGKVKRSASSYRQQQQQQPAAVSRLRLQAQAQGSSLSLVSVPAPTPAPSQDIMYTNLR